MRSQSLKVLMLIDLVLHIFRPADLQSITTPYVFSIQNQHLQLHFGINSYNAFYNCIILRNFSCEVTWVNTTNSQAYVTHVQRTSYNAVTTLLKTCYILVWAKTLSCSQMFTHDVTNREVLLMRQDGNLCYDAAFITPQNWSVYGTDLVTKTDTSRYRNNTCREFGSTDSPTTRWTSTLVKSTFGVNTNQGRSTLKANVTGQGSTATESTRFNTVLLSVGTSDGLTPSNCSSHNKKGREKNSKETKLIITLCVVFGSLILTGVIVTLVVNIRKMRQATTQEERETNSTTSSKNHNRDVKQKTRNEEVVSPGFMNVLYTNKYQLNHFDESNETSDYTDIEADANLPTENTYDDITIRAYNHTPWKQGEVFVNTDISQTPMRAASNARTVQLRGKAAVDSEPSVDSTYEYISGTDLSMSTQK
ncbi:hypothetical protein Bpfe_019981 [Biomphalaria pfeifferi]|uniref:Uncharacterized protein n=1 Tax=Biomphalaria pfeifferi TaxID=112525 RepID=A0AAD8F5B4_BIOPF|nr:hypothetical protein Bpfe_019981 [Biomphalaria pfeifferi]